MENFLQLLLVAISISAAAGLLGSFAILKRMALVGDALSHVALPGIALALILNLNPFLGAITFLFAAIVGTPFLLSVSTKLISVLEKAFSYLPEGRQQVSQFSLAAPTAPVVSAVQFFWFTVVVLAVTAISSSFIIGSIRTGSKSEGLKYIPFVLVGAYIIFKVVTVILDQFFITLT